LSLAALRLYHEVGEKHQFPSTSADAVASKRQTSQAAAAFLLRSSAKLQQAVERQQVASSDESYSTATESEEEPVTGRERKSPQTRAVSPSKRRHPRKRATKKQSIRKQATRKKLTTKRATSMKSLTRNTNQLPAGQSPTSFIESRITKAFDQGHFDGTIIAYDEDAKFWKVKYDDGDEEDFEYDEVIGSISLYDFLHSDQSQSASVSISDGEQGEIPSMAMADAAEGEPHPVQSTGTEIPGIATRIQVQGVSQDTSQQLTVGQNATIFVERRITKYFNGVRYDGTIVSYDEDAKFWKVVYDDGDFEEFEYNDVVNSISLFDLMHSDQSQSTSVSISDGEQGENRSMVNADTAEGEPDPGQSAGTEIPDIAASIQVSQETKQGESAMDHDNVQESVSSSVAKRLYVV
jgi:hypothetical protein